MTPPGMPGDARAPTTRWKLRETRDLDECRALWNRHSPREFPYDLWEYRLAFHRGYRAEPRFVVVSSPDGELGLIPLEVSPEIGKLSLFGGADWNEHLRLFLGESPAPGRLDELFEAVLPEGIEPRFLDRSNLRLSKSLREHCPTYYRDVPRGSAGIDFVTAPFKSKKRQRFRRWLASFDSRSPEIGLGGAETTERIFELSRGLYGARSTFAAERFVAAFRLLGTDPILRQMIRILRISFGGRIRAGAICLSFGDSLYYLCGAYDREMENLGHYLNAQVIFLAQRLGARRIEALAEDCGWKERWGFEQKMLYRYSRATAPRA